jgi:hypothetical protein
MHNRSGDGRTQSSSRGSTGRRSTGRRSTGRRLAIIAIASAGAAVMVAGSAYADPVENAPADGVDTSSPSYQLGYHQTFSDYEIVASRMRAEGFGLEDIEISGRVDAVCANEAQSVQSTPELTGPEFMRGCADAVESLVQAKIAS